MADFKPEKLIPLIRMIRKIRSCNPKTRINFMQQIPQLFHSHGAQLVLADIFVAGLCNRKCFGEITEPLHDAIDALLPDESTLDIKDSIYESKLVESPEKDNEDKQPNNQKKKLSLTLLRIPADLQCHLFNFLEQNDLCITQRVCRALCIAARNPCCLFSMRIKARHYGNYHLFDECYSRPKSLSVDHNWKFREPLIWNKKWGQHVIELIVEGISEEDSQNALPFVKLEKCTINEVELPTFRNLGIVSYSTLKELTLTLMDFTEDIMDHVAKFKNLEMLSLFENEWSLRNEQRTDPIEFPKLKTFRFGTMCEGSRVFERILIGSHLQFVMIKEPLGIYFDPPAETTIKAMREIRHFNLDQYFLFHDRNFLTSVSAVLEQAPSTNQVIFEESRIDASLAEDIDDHVVEYTDDADSLISPIISFFQFSKKSVLELTLSSCSNLPTAEIEAIPTKIYEAPYGTFSEINVYIYDIAKWMRPWLMFNKEMMKKIGVHRLFVKLLYNDSKWLEATGWKKIDRRCNTWLDGTKYHVALSLQT